VGNKRFSGRRRSSKILRNGRQADKANSKDQEEKVACGWRIVISPAAGFVTLLHSVVGLGPIELVVADSRGIGVG
jgi:hypothetical protein